jgi:integrase
MPVVKLTDLSVSKLKSEKQTRYWDAAFPAFGVLVGKRRKTFIIMHGSRRRLRTLGKYPALSLQQARLKAASMLDGSDAFPYAQVPLQCIEDYVRQLDAGNRWKAEQERLLRKHFLSKVSDLTAVTKRDILAITDSLRETPSEQLHCHRALKAFMNYLVARDIIPVSPMNGLPLPVSQKSRDRVLSPVEVKQIWHETKDLHSFGLVLRACILLGTRRGETTAIQSSWIQEDTLVIPSTETKSVREHIVPLTPYSKKLVQQIAQAPRANWNSWNKLKKKINIDDWSVHDARRFFAVTHAQIGTLPHLISRLLNHAPESDEGVTAIYNRYKYLPELREALLRYEKHLASLGLEL